MANISKMSATDAPEAAPAHESAFFKMLPPELRLKIYKMVFHGARVHAVLTMKDDEPSGGGDHHLVRFRHSEPKHFDLLRTCRQIYDDALPTFWSEAALNLVQLREIAGSHAKSYQWLNSVNYTADDYSYHLCNSLPEVVKANVKHVRGMILPTLHGDFVKKNPQLTAAEMLSNFKRLVTCDISPTVLDHPAFGYVRIGDKSIIERNSGVNNENGTQNDNEGSTEGISEKDPTDPPTCYRGRFKAFWQNTFYEPKDLLRKICGLDATAEVVFLAKVELSTKTFRLNVGVPPGPAGGLAGFKPENVAIVLDMPAEIPRKFGTVKQYWNLSAGVFCEVEKGTVADEEGYDMVIHPASGLEELTSQTC